MEIKKKILTGLASMLSLFGIAAVPTLAQTSDVTIAVCYLGWLSENTCLALGVTESLIGIAISLLGYWGMISAATGGIAGVVIGGVAL